MASFRISRWVQFPTRALCIQSWRHAALKAAGVSNRTRPPTCPLSLCSLSLALCGAGNPTTHHTPPTLQQKRTDQPQQPCVPHTAIQRVLNLYLEKVNGITHGEPYNFIISRSFCSLHRFHEGPSALMALE